MTIIEEIRIKLVAVNTRFKREMKQATKSMNDFNKEIYRASLDNSKFAKVQKQTRVQQEAFRDSMKGGAGVMALSHARWKKVNDQGYKFTTMTGRAANGVRKMTHGLKGFRMEMLGVMFFGMSLTRLMGGLMGKSLEWTGVMDVMSSALGILFLPIAMKLLDWALLFLDWVSNLSEDQKKLIGTIALVVAAFGLFLTIIGILALGIGSIIQVFGPLFKVFKIAPLIIKGISAAFTAISAPILAIIAIIVAVVIGMVIAWKNNFMGMKQTVAWFISGVKDFFSGLFKFFKGIFQVIKGLFTGNWSMILDGIINIFEGFVLAVWGIIKMMVNGIMAIFTGITQIVWNVIKAVWGFFVWLWEKLVGHSLIPDLVNAIIGWFLSIPGKIWNAIKGVGKMFLSAFTGIVGWFAQLPSKISGAFTGILGWFKKLPGKVWSSVKGVGKMVKDAFTDMIPSWMLKIFKGGTSFIKGIAKKATGWLGFAEGGVVPGPKGAPMPAIVHGGERITPPGQEGGGSVNQTITINAQVSNDYDVRKLADQLNRYWVSDINKMTKSK